MAALWSWWEALLRPASDPRTPGDPRFRLARQVRREAEHCRALLEREVVRAGETVRDLETRAQEARSAGEAYRLQKQAQRAREEQNAVTARLAALLEDLGRLDRIHDEVQREVDRARSRRALERAYDAADRSREELRRTLDRLGDALGGLQRDPRL